MDDNNVLIIFVKNFIPGQVKTRLAKTMGDDKAIKIYKYLVGHTFSITTGVKCRKIVYYSHYIEPEDLWDAGFQKLMQQGNDLGEKMCNAFATAFANGYQKAIIIGSDCLDITRGIIDKAFAALDKSDMVIGPATDGGYYLLGMKEMQTALFNKKSWSTDQVYKETMSDINAMGLSSYCLPTLSDIDEEKDVPTLNF